MPSKTFYVKPVHAQLFEEAEEYGRRTGRSLSDLIAEGLRLALVEHGVHGPAKPVPSYVPAPPRAPVPNPFAATE
jgi:hypothetical protein